jgi:hypothetical protein
LAIAAENSLGSCFAFDFLEKAHFPNPKAATEFASEIAAIAMVVAFQKLAADCLPSFLQKVAVLIIADPIKTFNLNMNFQWRLTTI